MNYDFDKLIDRRMENSLKWNCKDNELPMWVADMDFEVAPCIKKKMEERISHPCFGYSEIPARWAKSYISFWQDAFGTTLKEEALLFSLGIIPSLSTSIRAFSSPGDEVILLTPVYNIFNHSVENNGRLVVPVSLLNENEAYSIDFASLEAALCSEKAKILVLCNPHNPVGRIWSKDELARLASLCKKHGVLVISDEVHGPISYGKSTYVPYVSSCEEAKMNSITLLAPTKSFNVAGVQTSACYAESKEIRDKLAFALNADEVMEGNFLSYDVAISCFDEGRDWLSQMNAYVHKNYLFVKSFLKEQLPKAKLAPLEATYLIWVDISSYEKDDVSFCDGLRKETGLWITPGSTYGTEGKGHVRINLACPRSRVSDGLNRLFSYCEKLQ